MGLFDFVKAAGRAIGIGSAEAAPSAEDLKKEVAGHGLAVDGLDVKVDGDKVSVTGNAVSQADKEKVILALGNVAGVAKVEDNITASTPEPEAVFYTVKKGDTLSAIAKAQYGNANKYNAIFEADREVIRDANLIFRGQKIRLPKL